MTDTLFKTERLAHNAILTLIARAAVVLAAPLVAWNIKTMVDMQSAIARIPDQILVVETRLMGRVSATEDRLGAYLRRMDSHEQRIERLERPFFDRAK